MQTPRKIVMTSRERWLAAVQLRPLDRLPFWPKLDAAYAPAQRTPFRDMTTDALHEWIGSDPQVGCALGVREVRKRTAVCVQTDGNDRRTVFETAYGSLERVDRFDAISQSWHPMTFPVRDLRGIRLMAEWWADCRVEVDQDSLQAARAFVKQVGPRAVTAATIGESPLMLWVEWLAGVEQAHLLLADHPEEVEGLFAAIHGVLMRKTELAVQYCPADLLYFSENTSTTLISPGQYRRYCVSHLTDYGAITRAAGRPLLLHMCGHLKALLPDLARLPVQGFEAFTAPTVGNTTLFDGRDACPDKCLIGGTNAEQWLHPACRIIARLERDLAALPHHRGLVISSAGVMPPACAPETIREVCGWLQTYPARW